MFGRVAKAAGVDYWVDQIEQGAFTIPAAAAYIANAAAGDDMVVFDAKQIAASKTTCALDTEAEIAEYQLALGEARGILEAVSSGSDAAAFSPFSLSAIRRDEQWLTTGDQRDGVARGEQPVSEATDTRVSAGYGMDISWPASGNSH